MHGFYFHPWYPANRPIFGFFREIFEIKNFLAGLPSDAFLDNIPSHGQVARVNVHHYPSGGGYQAEHIDPTGAHARIQTLVVASEMGRDFNEGGLYARERADAEPQYLDYGTGPGDLIVLSPGIQHGVAPVDPNRPDYAWRSNSGRWIIIPIIVATDYPEFHPPKPVQVPHP
jgi:hypothetical protein